LLGSKSEHCSCGHFHNYFQFPLLGSYYYQ